MFNEFYIPEEEIITNDKLNNNEPIEEIEFNIDFKASTIDDKDITIKNTLDNISYEDVKKEEDIYNSLKKLNTNINKESNFNSISEVKDSNNKDIVNNNIDTNIKEERIQENKTEKIKHAKFPDLKVIGQFNKMYILAQYEDILYIIDQHAAHEKILFEKYLNSIEEGHIIIQKLLVPTLIELTNDDFCYYEENKDIFLNAGFIIEPFGGNTIAIKEVPYFLGKLDPRNLFMNILDNIKSLGTGKTTEVKYNKIATLACKAAVKANDYLTDEEMKKLINDLRYIEDPFHCPHGRPVIIKFSNYDLDKKFRRIV